MGLDCPSAEHAATNTDNTQAGRRRPNLLLTTSLRTPPMILAGNGKNDVSLTHGIQTHSPHQDSDLPPHDFAASHRR
jgi:hypothetical protein